MFSNSERFSLVKSNIEALKADIEKIFESKSNFSLEEIAPSQLNKQIAAISASKYKGNEFVLWEPAKLKGCCIFYSNFRDGWYTLMYKLAIEYRKELFIVCLDPLAAKGQMAFYHYSNGDERIVRALYDAKWTYYEKGKLLPFENGEYYQREHITDRINNDIIKEYLRSSGADLDNVDLFKSNSSFLVGRYV